MITQLIAILLLLPLFLQAQQGNSRPGITGSCWLAGTGSIYTGEGGVSLSVFKPGKNWAPHIQVSAGSIAASGVPAGYRPGFTLWGDGKPVETYTVVSAGLTRLMPQQGRRWLFFASAGPALVVVNRNVAYVENAGPVLLEANYTIKQQLESNAGLRADAGVMMRIGGIAGLSFGGSLTVAPHTIFAGFRLGWGFGSHKKLFWR